MPDSNDSATPEVADTVPPVRSARAVLAILGSFAGIAIIAILVVLAANGTFSGDDGDEGGNGSGGSADMVAGTNPDRFQAVYLVNDRVFFGKLRDGAGDWVDLEDAYFLRSAAADAAKAGDETAAETEIVPVRQEVGGTGDLRINTNEISLVQDLAEDSEISSTLEDADR